MGVYGQSLRRYLVNLTYVFWGITKDMKDARQPMGKGDTVV